MRYAKIFVILGALALVGIGSATLLGSFGSIAGTTNISPAVEIDRIDNVNTEVDLTKNTAQNIETSDNLNLLNATGDNANSLASDIEIGSETKNVSVNLEGVDRIELEIQGEVIDGSDLT